MVEQAGAVLPIEIKSGKVDKEDYLSIPREIAQHDRSN